MRVAYAATYDCRTPASWSGTGYFMWRALADAGAQVELISPLHKPLLSLWRAKSRIYRRLLHATYELERQPWLLRQYARQVGERLDSGAYDVVVSPGSLPLAYLSTRIPIVFWTDATFDGMVDFYGNYKGLARQTLRDGHAAEQAALSRCALALYASDWAAETALAHYEVDRSRVRVVPFGANLRREPEPAEVERAIANRSMERCRLLFVAVEWERKGGDLAVATAAELIRRGVDTTLTVVGVAPPDGGPPFVRYAGFIDKAVPADVDRYERLLSDAHFLIVPSTAEAYGLVYAEASAFGVPSLGLRVGGVPTVVKDGATGRLFVPGVAAAEIADFVQAQIADPRSYRRLASSAAADYRDRLNWRVAGARAHSMIETLVRPEASRPGAKEP